MNEWMTGFHTQRKPALSELTVWLKDHDEFISPYAVINDFFPPKSFSILRFKFYIVNFKISLME